MGKRLRELGLFGLEKVRGPHQCVPTTQTEGVKEEPGSSKLCPVTEVMHTNWSTGNSIHTQGILFCAKGDKTLKHVSQPVRVSVPGDIQNPTGPGCRQPPVAGPALGLY